MQIQKITVGLEDGKTLIVHEADGSFDARLNEKEREAEKLLDDDKTFLYFSKFFYPLLYACTTGEDVPDARQAYQLPYEKMDEWYSAFWKLNPEIIIRPLKDPKSEEIIFRDDTKITVYETLDMPSFMLALHRFEQEAEDHPPANPDEVAFRVLIYPKIAACSKGDVPNAGDACQFPRMELAKWSDAAMRLNPDWFSPIMEAAETIEKKEQVKKKRRSRKAGKKAFPVLQK